MQYSLCYMTLTRLTFFCFEKVSQRMGWQHFTEAISEHKKYFGCQHFSVCYRVNNHPSGALCLSGFKPLISSVSMV